MNKVENQINRMKAMMTYGLTTEGKEKQYKSVEYQREGADGKTYGIVREGAKFYIKVSDKKNNVLKEDFDYIGGFRNRKNNEYTSYANALKHFDLKMIGLNEAAKNGKHIVIESWNPDKKEELAVEATEKMRKEIERQRQIMSNVNTIEENKNYSVTLDEACCNDTGKGKGNGCCGKVDSECAATQKDNIKRTKSSNKAKTKGGDPFTKNANSEMSKMQKNNIKNGYKPVMSEGEQVLGWNENPDYIDTENGTEIGDTAPFTETNGSKKELENGTVEEETAMHKEGENQNSPEVGTNKIGDTAPFTKQVSEGVEDDDLGDVEDLDSEDEDFDDEGLDSEDEDLDSEDDDFDDEDLDSEDDDFDSEDDDFDDEDLDSEDDENDMESRISSIETMLNKIADKLGIDEFEDDKLYDDDEDLDSEDDDFDDEDLDSEDDDFDDEDLDSEDEDFDDEDLDSEDDDDETEVFESKNYRKMMMSEDKLDYFGKHPAYRKSPMKLPSNKHNEFQGYDDINDESVKGEMPYGEKIGDGAPFEISKEELTDAIAESIKKNMKKKI